MLGRLEGAATRGLEIDAVAHSRGGLVLRSMIESLLPKTKGVRVRRAVFVGATNDGRIETKQQYAVAVRIASCDDIADGAPRCGTLRFEFPPGRVHAEVIEP